MSYVLLDIHCAECRYRDNPLVDQLKFFDTLDEAKLHVSRGEVSDSWIDHPLGGVFYPAGDGDIWIVPTSLFVKKEQT